MALSSTAQPAQRVLIVSSHPLFREGLRSLLRERQSNVEVVGLVSHTDEAVVGLQRLRPDLVILDYDDEAVNRDEFLARFVEGEGPPRVRVVLVSLKQPDQAVVYDRHALAASQVEDWLEGLEAEPPPREQNLLSDRPRRANMKHFVIVGVLVSLVTLLVSLGLDKLPLLPVAASAQAVPIDRLFGLHFKTIAFLFALIVVFLVYSVIVFRRKPGETGDGDHFDGHTGLEIVWTIAPLVTVLYFAYIGAGALGETRRVVSDALEVKVTASQWSWSFEYPTYGVSSTTLNLPVNRQVLLKLTSTDVIHSFWVPEFRVKQDALPGENMVKELRITPTLIGEYKVRCAELCGRQHAYMQSPVVVMDAADFDRWIAEQSKVSNDPVEQGKKWAAQFGCIACHSVDGSRIVGPSWKGLYAETVTLSDGASVTVDGTYLRNAILDPNLQVADGYPANVMPGNFKERLTEDQVNDLIAYIQSLK